jgi:hypothetical protein
VTTWPVNAPLFAALPNLAGLFDHCVLVAGVVWYVSLFDLTSGLVKL